jgi:hypothetical protein
VISASNSEVIGDEDNRPFGRGCHPGLFWASKRCSSSTSPVSSALILVPILVVVFLVVSVVVVSIHAILEIKNIRVMRDV